LHHPKGVLVLGAVFLCTTGAEALYADLGHCGRQNIQISWIFVKTALVLNYLGQASWLLKHEGQHLDDNPFYGVMPHWFLWPGIIIATMAAIIASQALISGSFTLVSEAIRLGLLPKMTVKFPTNMKGQLYIPAINTFLWLGCVGVVLLFKESKHMEAAYGLAIVLAMLCTTILLSNWLVMKRINSVVIWLMLVFYLLLEGLFFWANASKFHEGGYVTVLMAVFLFGIMLLWVTAKGIRQRYMSEVKIKDYLDQLITLSNDHDIPKYATNLVFMSSTKNPKKVEDSIMYSILQTQPKRADVYWFVNITTTDEPYTMQYEVNTIAVDDVYKVNFFLGFRVQQRMNVFMKRVVEEMLENGEVSVHSRYHTQSGYPTGDFRFVLMKEFLSNENELPWAEQIIMEIYLGAKALVSAPKNWFGLDSDSVEEETAPLVLEPVKDVKLARIKKGGES
jgi:KUP system potassium uptake protein